MSGQILVVLKRNEQVEEIIPYVEKVARPGMKAIFLFRYPVAGDFLWLGDHCITAESPAKAMLAGQRVLQRYSWDVQRGLAEQRISSAREALRVRRIEVAVDVYAGGVRRAVRDCAAKGDVHLIMIGASSGSPIAQLLRRMVALLGLFRRPPSVPVLLLNPRHV